MNRFEQLELTKQNIEKELKAEYEAVQKAQQEQLMTEQRVKAELEIRQLCTNYYISTTEMIDFLMKEGNVPPKMREALTVSWIVANVFATEGFDQYRVRNRLSEFYTGKAYVEEK